MNPFKTARDIPASPEAVFAAISDPKRLALWWGPKGFTNEFRLCEFKSGGRWSFTMRGPDGREYANETTFALVDPLKKIVIRHDSLPKYELTIELSPSTTGTLVSWTQRFEKDEVAKSIAHIVAPANEQNLDRLTAEVLK